MTNEEFTDFLKKIIQRVKFEPDSEEALRKYKLDESSDPSTLSLEELAKAAGGVSTSDKRKKK